MILTRTPLRTSFVGGGSDLPAYCQRGNSGAVLSAAVSAYVYVAISRQFNPHLVRVSYSMTENVSRASDLNHDLIRESLAVLGIRKGIEINTIADVPGRGTGLGSSAAVTVGTLLGLHHYAGKGIPHVSWLAKKATEIEMETLGKPIGLQDQYAVAYGGFNEIWFHPNGTVDVKRIALSMKVAVRINQHLRLYFTGITRASGGLLEELQTNLYEDDDARENVRKLVALVPETVDALETGQMQKLGYLLDKAWAYKMLSNKSISNAEINRMYREALGAGAYGGKLLGAGAGGFLLLVVPPDKQDAVSEVLGQEPMILNYGVPGAMIIFDDGRESWNGPQ